MNFDYHGPQMFINYVFNLMEGFDWKKKNHILQIERHQMSQKFQYYWVAIANLGRVPHASQFAQIRQPPKYKKEMDNAKADQIIQMMKRTSNLFITASKSLATRLTPKSLHNQRF